MSASKLLIRVLAAAVVALLLIPAFAGMTAAPLPGVPAEAAYAMPPREAPDPPGKSTPPPEGDSDLLAVGEIGAAGGPVGYNFLIRNDAETETMPAIAYSTDRNEYLVVWYNDRPGNDDVRAQRVSARGTLEGGPFYVAAGTGYERRYPDVTYNSQTGKYLVVWAEEAAPHSRIVAQVVSGAGGLEGGPITIASDLTSWQFNSDPAVAYAFTSNKFLVAWYVYSATSGRGIVGQVLNANGSLNGPQFVIEQDPIGEPRSGPDLAYNLSRNEYLVAWTQYMHSDDIVARRVTGDGVALSPATIEITGSVAHEAYQAVAALASADQYLVVWRAEHILNGYDIRARIVSGAGAVSPTIVDLAASGLNESYPAAVGMNSAREYLVVWTQASAPPLLFKSIFGRGLASSGALQNPVRFVGGLFADDAAVAAGQRDFMVVFEDMAPAGNLGIFGQLWGNRTYLPAVVRR